MDIDAQLVALMDGELDADRSARLLARIATDDILRKRYSELRGAGASIATALDALLERAPLTRLRAALPSKSAGPARS
jgi:anti-sigma factor RsiW